MENRYWKKIVFMSLFCLFLAEIGLVFAQTPNSGGLENIYPTMVPGVRPPQAESVFLPHFIRYIYYFFIISGGLITFLTLIYGGFRFLTSAGNPAATTDARNQILAGFLGLAIILGSYIVLNEINPDLVSLRVPLTSALRNGIIVYSKANCADLPGTEAETPELVDLPADVRFKTLKTTGSVVLGQDDDGNPNLFPLSFYSFNSADELVLELYQNEKCQGDPSGTISDLTKNTCRAINVSEVKCIRLIWYLPGVWVFNALAGTNHDELPDPKNLPANWQEGKEYLVFQTSQDSLPSGFNDRIRAIALVPNKEPRMHYGVILHNIPGGLMKEKGWAHIFLPGSPSPSGNTTECQSAPSDPTITVCGKFPNIAASSLTIFNVPESGVAEYAVTICRNDRCEPQKVDNSSCPDNVCEAQIILSPGGELADITSTFGSAISPYNQGSGLVYGRNFENDTWDTGEAVRLRRSAAPGISSIRIEEGAHYLMLLYERHYDDFSDINNDFGTDAAIINQGVPALRTIQMDGRVGTMIVIRARSASD